MLIRSSSWLNLTPKANYRTLSVKSRTAFWFDRKGGGYDENLTQENQEFLKQVIIDKYVNKESPLENGPWKRGEFDPNGV